MLPKRLAFQRPRTFVFLLAFLLVIPGTLSAQERYEFPLGDFWSLSGGIGMSGFIADGVPFQTVFDPRLWLSPSLLVGSRVGVGFSAEDDGSNLLYFEGQVYLRWNFMQLGRAERPNNLFLQGGIGLLSVYRGYGANVFNDVTRTRGSLLADVAAGVTIPLTDRWYIEPSVRAGYPHIVGFSLTAGFKFPLPRATHEIVTREVVTPGRVEYVETIRALPASEIVSRVMISAVEFVLFGPDIGRYNIGIDYDARQLNELVLNYTAQTLLENPDNRVRIEGHANPYTINISEIDELQVLSAMRSNVVAEQLRQRGVSDEQMVIVSFGGTRTVTNEWDVRNRNRRVELIILQVDTD
ncbi:MAG: OmpA family protein [Treponema sp.]|jgi:hypothetical protein|nr:OmpA family protein [Treponema sp.]